MAPSERAKQLLKEAEGGGSARAQTLLGVCHLQGQEGLHQDKGKAAALFRKAADLGRGRVRQIMPANCPV
jgi:TPR repeat protein